MRKFSEKKIVDKVETLILCSVFFSRKSYIAGLFIDTANVGKIF